MIHLPDAVRPPYYKPKKRGRKPIKKTENDKQNEKLKRSISAKIAREYKNGKLLNLAREILAAEDIGENIEPETIAAEFRERFPDELPEKIYKILINKINADKFARLVVSRLIKTINRETIAEEIADEMEGDKKDISENLADEIADEIRTGKTHENKPILAKRINAAILDEIETRLNDKISGFIEENSPYIIKDLIGERIIKAIINLKNKR